MFKDATWLSFSCGFRKSQKLWYLPRGRENKHGWQKRSWHSSVQLRDLMKPFDIWYACIPYSLPACLNPCIPSYTDLYRPTHSRARSRSPAPEPPPPPRVQLKPGLFGSWLLYFRKDIELNPYYMYKSLLPNKPYFASWGVTKPELNS